MLDFISLIHVTAKLISVVHRILFLCGSMVCLFLCDNFILGFPEKQNQHNVCVCMCVYFEELAYVTYRGLQVQNVLGWPAAWRPREGLMLQIKFAFILIDILCLILCVS